MAPQGKYMKPFAKFMAARAARMIFLSGGHLISAGIMLRVNQHVQSESNRRETSQGSGCVICAGFTSRSNSAPVTKPSRIASSRSVVPFLCAVLAICAALS